MLQTKHEVKYGVTTLAVRTHGVTDDDGTEDFEARYQSTCMTCDLFCPEKILEFVATDHIAPHDLVLDRL
jgi:Pyruvate/2-oxoacid:ferredoxin oxidoreductase delta subunit